MRDNTKYKKVRDFWLNNLLSIEYHFRCLDCKQSFASKTRTGVIKYYMYHGHKNVKIVHVLNSKHAELTQKDIDEWVGYLLEDQL